MKLKQDQATLLKPDLFDRLVSAASTVLLLIAVVALVKGQDDWAKLPAMVWLHLGTVAVALVLTPVMLLRRRGDPMHRMLGRVWIAAMFLTALVSLNIRSINHGQFSAIHLLSIFTMVMAPLAVYRARKGQIETHRSAVRGMALGGLVIAGFFTFPFGRQLGIWLFS